MKKEEYELKEQLLIEIGNDLRYDDILRHRLEKHIGDGSGYGEYNGGVGICVTEVIELVIARIKGE